MRSRVVPISVVFGLALIVLFANLGGPKLWDRDEPRNAGCAAEMLRRGDWVTPIFNDELRSHKPVLLYWLMMTAYSVFGVNEFAARFWSAALATGSVLLTFTIGRHLFSARVGVWAALILTTTLMFDVAARAATPDATLVFFTTAATAAYLLTTFRRTSDGDLVLRQEGCFFPRQWWASLLIYGVMGLAVLTKGPMGLVLPTAVIGMFLLIMRLPSSAADPSAGTSKPPLLRRASSILRPFAPLHFLTTCRVMRPLTAILMVSLVALPWYVWVGLRTDGDWLRGFFLEHNLRRAMRPMEGHGGGLWFYPAAILIGFFPWSIFALPTAIDAGRQARSGDRSSTGIVFILAWVCVYVGLFSLAQTKLPSYITPCYPALALLTACYVTRWSDGSAQVGRPWPWISFGCLASVGVVLLVGLPITARRFLPGEEWLGTLGAIPLVGAFVAFGCLARFDRSVVLRVHLLTSAVFCLALFAVASSRVDRHQQASQLLQAAAEYESGELGAYRCLEPSWVFYSKRPIQFLSDDARSSPPRTQPWKVREPRPLAEFLKRDNLVITTERMYREIPDALRTELQVVAEVPYFLRNERLVLIKRR